MCLFTILLAWAQSNRLTLVGCIRKFVLNKGVPPTKISDVGNSVLPSAFECFVRCSVRHFDSCLNHLSFCWNYGVMSFSWKCNLDFNVRFHFERKMYLKKNTSSPQEKSKGFLKVKKTCRNGFFCTLQKKKDWLTMDLKKLKWKLMN